MRKLWHVPIEKVNTRYTTDWTRVFEQHFTQAPIDFETVAGIDVPSEITDGDVLDAISTNMYKTSQLQQLYAKIQNGEIQDDDVIFFSDAWFPGLESLAYIKHITGKKFKIVGILHAGSWDPFDFVSRTGMRAWAKHQELCWLNCIDIVFVATQFHKDLIVLNSGEFNSDKIFVTGIPPCIDEKVSQYSIPYENKENTIVFPHRISEEKQPQKFDTLAKKYPQWKFVKTLDVCKTREDYFKLLAKSKVMISYAQQETFGISTLEAMALGCLVIVPDKLSYKETVPEDFRYTNENQIKTILENFMKNPHAVDYSKYETPDIFEWDKTAVPKMLKVIQVKLREFERLRLQEAESEKVEQKRKADERARKNQERADAKKNDELAILEAQEELNARQLMGEGGEE